MANCCIRVVYLFTLVVSCVLIKATRPRSKETSTIQNLQTLTNESVSKKARTNQMSLLGDMDTLEKRLLFEKVSWSSWTTWSACSITCGKTGVHSRKRTCVKPGPIPLGECPGSSSSTRPCYYHCPVNGHWSPWSVWSHCSISCGRSGHRSRYRSCNHPAPAYGGTHCHGSSSNAQTCNHKCPEWSAWLYTPCSVTCGTGSKQGMRRCNSGHEEDCVGSALKTETCTESPCPVDGGWGKWHAWGSCSQTCGDGTRHRRRLCDSPVPAHMGKPCHGNMADSSTCHVVDCPSWCAYYEVGTCSVTCGDGVIQLQRNCSTGTNRDCTGSPYDEKPCLRHAC